MNITLHVFQVNSDFSPEYAAANHNGQESENNPKYDWEDELHIQDNVDTFQIVRNGTYQLAGQYENGTSFQEEIKQMFLIELSLKNGQIGQIRASESMFLDYKETITDSHTTIELYLKDYEPFWNEIPGVYIASKEFPKNIQLHDRD